MNIHSKSGALEHRSSPDSEAGFMLVFVVVIAALMLIALSIAAPIVAKDLRRDKEVESEHRAQQYVRAIRLYHLKNRTYPPSLDALENTNNVRYLRKQYIDPLTGKNDWRIIHVGENKTTVKGFFGQPLGGVSTSGAGSNLGSASSLSSSGFGATTPPSGSTSPAGTATGPTTVNSNSPLSAGFAGATIGGSTSGGAAGSSTSSSSSSSLGSGGVGQIMGVGTSKTGDSILNPNQQTTYETWEFLYDPKIELLYQKANILGGPASVSSQPASSFGSSGATGQPNSPAGPTSTPTAPTPPMQPSRQ